MQALWGWRLRRGLWREEVIAMKKVAILKILLPLIVLCIAFAIYNIINFQQIKVIIVSKTPMGAYAEGNDPDYYRGIGWYNIGLSRNGKEPIEYIWRASSEPSSYYIINSEIGDRGIVRLSEYAKDKRKKLPRPNAEDPPMIGALGEVEWYWIGPVSDIEGRAR